MCRYVFGLESEDCWFPGLQVQNGEIVSGLCMGAKLFLSVIVLVPKFAISVGLLVFGGRLVVTSQSDADCLFNSLAAYFVAEIDDYIYQFLSPRLIKDVIATPAMFPPLEKSGDLVECKSLCDMLCGTYFRGGAILGLTTYVASQAC